MSRTLTVIRPRILTGFMLNFAARVGEQERILTNGTTAVFDLSEGEETLTLSPTNNPNLPSPEPLVIPAGSESRTAQLKFRSVGGRAVWYLELE